MAAQTQCGERERRSTASASLTSPVLTALRRAKSSSSCTCVTCTSCKKYCEKAMAWSATSTSQPSIVLGSTSKTRATARMPKPSASAPTAHTSRSGATRLPCKRRAMGLLEIAITARAMQPPPGATTGMPIGTDIAEPDPAPIGTVRMRAEMPRGVHLARPSPRRHDTGWRATGCLGDGLVGLLTGGKEGLAGEARKRLRVAGTLARRRQRFGWLLIPSGTRVWPGIMQHDAEPEESQEHQLVEKEV